MYTIIYIYCFQIGLSILYSLFNMKTITVAQYIFTILLNLIYMSADTSQASVPVTWLKSNFFKCGQFTVSPSTSGTSFTVAVTYSPALTASPIKKPSIGITDMNYDFTLPTVYMKVDIPSYTQTGLSAFAIMNYVGTYSIKVYYLAPDPSLAYYFNSLTWNTSNSALGPYTGPFNAVNNLGISGISGPGMNTSHQVTMLVFINGYNLTSSAYCFELILTIRLAGPTTQQLNFTSNCVGMVASFIAYSRIIFDVTAIQDFGYLYFQYGTYRALNNDMTTLGVNLNLFVPQNFLLGVSQFKYTSPTGPILISFNTTLSASLRTTAHTAFQRLAFNYWSLKQRYCPPAYPIFHLDTSTCHNGCPDGTYYVASTQMCQNCFYTCGTCTGYPACATCDASSNRVLNGTSCLPEAGFYENGTFYAQPCTPGCIDCTNASVCITCDTGLQLNASHQCQSICMQGCTICPNLTTCTSCNTGGGYYLVNSTCYYCNSSLNDFINLTTLSCQSCNIVGCTNCFSLTACTECDLPNSYAIEGLICGYCNNSENQFINSSSLCQQCSLDGCITCTSLTTCSLCNQTQNYYLQTSTCSFCNSSLNYFLTSNTSGTYCQLCTLPNCIQCQSLTSCSLCNISANYYLVGSGCVYCDNSINQFINLTTLQCQNCSLEGCVTCASLTVCSLCDVGNNYYGVGLICGYCNNTLNQFINGSSLCQACSLVGCITCISLSSCSLCNSTQSYYLQNSTCLYCNLSLSYYITSLDTCQYCNNSINFFINSTSQCQACSIQGCITCTSLSTCSVCDTSNNYYTLGAVCGYCNNTLNQFINGSSLCEACSLVGCITCISLSSCSLCNSTQSYYLQNSTCLYCNLSLSYYITSLDTCQYCNNSINFFINSTSQCQACSIQGCITCTSLSTCSVCDTSNNYYTLGAVCGYCNNTLNQFINGSSLCEACSLVGCITCISLSSCSLCNSTQSYYLQNSTCLYCNLSLSYYITSLDTCQYCNNSINFFINSTSQCQACSIQGCITCTSLSTCSVCDTSNNYYTLGAVCGYCNNTLNQFINASTLLCQPCTLSNCLMCNDLLTCSICNNSAGYFLSASSLQCQPCNIQGCLECQSLTACKECNSEEKYTLNSSNLCNSCGGCECQLGRQLPSAIPAVSYPQKNCMQFQKSHKALFAILIMSLITMVLATFTTCLIGVEMIGVLQLAFLNLGDNLFVHLYLGPLLDWYYVNGFNIKPKQFHIVPQNIQQIGYTNTFLHNINVMFAVLIFSTVLLIIVQILASVFLFNINKIRSFARQFMMGTYLFNCLNVAFCVGLQYQYPNPQGERGMFYNFSVACTVLVVILYVVAVIWLILANKLSCGEYKYRFKQDCTNQLYIPITILYRFSLGLYMSMDNESDQSTLLILAISLFFVMYNIINLSYKKFYHNYRANISHLTHLIILVVTNYYRSMKSNTPLTVKALINTPAIIEIVFIGLCVGVALLNAVYEIVIKLRNIIRKIGRMNKSVGLQSSQPISNNSNNSHISKESNSVQNFNQKNNPRANQITQSNFFTETDEIIEQ